MMTEPSPPVERLSKLSPEHYKGWKRAALVERLLVLEDRIAAIEWPTRGQVVRGRVEVNIEITERVP